MDGIIDFHTHAFPDGLAERAITSLEAHSEARAFHNGTVSSLLKSMDNAGILTSVICSIATKPEQWNPIISWSREIRSQRIIPLPSIHPDDKEYKERLKIIKSDGFKGIKLHPYYQGFDLDDERVYPIYEAVLEMNLLLVMHTGYDIAFPGIVKADPVRILKVFERFPDIKMITTHLGSWKHWDKVESLLLGRNINMEMSFSLEFADNPSVKNILSTHPKEYLLFGTDSPWTDQKATLERFYSLGLDEETNRMILRDNAQMLLDSV